MRRDKPKTEKWNISAELWPLLGGHRNRAFRTTGLTQDLVFKSTTRSPAAMDWLLDIHKRARQAGFVVPQLLTSSGGNLIEDGWTCEAFIEGQHIARTQLPAIRPYLVRFHENASGIGQRPDFLSSVAHLVHSKGGDVDMDAMPDHLARKCRDAWQAVSQRPEAIVHGDLNTGNILRVHDGRFALLDWDESRRDLALFDLGQLEVDDDAGQRARLAWEIACSWIVEPAHARDLAVRL